MIQYIRIKAPFLKNIGIVIFIVGNSTRSPIEDNLIGQIYPSLIIYNHEMLKFASTSMYLRSNIISLNSNGNRSIHQIFSSNTLHLLELTLLNSNPEEDNIFYESINLLPLSKSELLSTLSKNLRLVIKKANEEIDSKILKDERITCDFITIEGNVLFTYNEEEIIKVPFQASIRNNSEDSNQI